MKFIQHRLYGQPKHPPLAYSKMAIGADRRGLIPVGAWNATFLNWDKANAAECVLGSDHLIGGGLIEIACGGGYITWGCSSSPIRVISPAIVYLS